LILPMKEAPLVTLPGSRARRRFACLPACLLACLPACMRGQSSPGSRANRHGGLCIIRKQKHDDAGSREGQGLAPSATPPPPANPFPLEQTDTSAAAATRRTGMTGFRCWHERRQREKQEKRRQRRNLCAAEALACRVHVCKCGALHGAGVDAPSKWRGALGCCDSSLCPGGRLRKTRW